MVAGSVFSLISSLIMIFGSAEPIYSSTGPLTPTEVLPHLFRNLLISFMFYGSLPGIGVCLELKKRRSVRLRSFLLGGAIAAVIPVVVLFPLMLIGIFLLPAIFAGGICGGATVWLYLKAARQLAEGPAKTRMGNESSIA
jgi:hypothetical protein